MLPLLIFQDQLILSYLLFPSALFLFLGVMFWNNCIIIIGLYTFSKKSWSLCVHLPQVYCKCRDFIIGFSKKASLAKLHCQCLSPVTYCFENGFYYYLLSVLSDASFFFFFLTLHASIIMGRRDVF